MKILLLNTSERIGGAAVAANRLLYALNKAGCATKMLVRDRQTDDENVVSVNTTWWKKQFNFLRFAYERWVIFVHNRFSKKNLFAVSIANTGTNISKHPLVKEADIIHLHWINQGFLSLKNIRQLIALGKPVVWTMHDMWASTGICHHARACSNYEEQCGECFFLRGSAKKDLSMTIFHQKQALLKNKQVTFVACSRWLTDSTKKSNLFTTAKTITIPNPLDIDKFKPQSKQECRKKLNLPEHKQLILFTAVNVTNPQKGFGYLAKSLSLLATANHDIAIVIVGKAKQPLPALPFKTHVIPFVKHENEMAEIYNATDIYVTPSLEENLPNTIMEAMACGVPCVGFNVGGIPEMIDHKINGYIAQYKSPEDLANGILWCLHNADKLSLEARKKVTANYAKDIIATQYMELYRSLLKQ
jgi:glycosyltransferase involved in cell wall biosynthesis